MGNVDDGVYRVVGVDVPHSLCCRLRVRYEYRKYRSRDDRRASSSSSNTVQVKLGVRLTEG